jgi:hypothetical protein
MRRISRKGFWAAALLAIIAFGTLTLPPCFAAGAGAVAVSSAHHDPCQKPAPQSSVDCPIFCHGFVLPVALVAFGDVTRALAGAAVPVLSGLTLAPDLPPPRTRRDLRNS